MTKNQANREAANVAEQQQADAKKMREAAARNSEEISDGSAFIYGPTFEIVKETKKATIPGVGEVDVNVFVAKFGDEEAIFAERKDARKFITEKRSKWVEENGQVLTLNKVRRRVYANSERVKAIVEAGDNLPPKVRDSLKVAYNALVRAYNELPKPPEKKKKKAQEQPPTLADAVADA